MRCLVAGSGGGEDGLGAHDVDTALGINELGDVDVAGYGDERVGVVAGEMGVVGDLLGEEGDHVADGDLGGGFEVFVEAHGDVLGGGFATGPEEAVGFVAGLGLVDDELEGAGELGLHGGDVDLAVALAGVAVAYFEESAFGVDGDIESGAGDHFFVVDVAGVHPGWGGVVLAGGLGRGDAHAAEERVQRDVDARGEVADHFVAVEGDDAGVAVGEVVGEEAAAGAEAVAGPGDVDVDLLDADFEDVAGFGFGDGYGAGEDVTAGTFFCGGDLGVDVADVLGNVGGFDAQGFEALGRAAGGEGLDGDGVAGVDGEDWLGFGRVVTPGYRGRGGEEGLVLLRGSGEGKERCGEQCGDAVEVGRHGFGIAHGSSLKTLSCRTGPLRVRRPLRGGCTFSC
jgi:hypothetical protein